MLFLMQGSEFSVLFYLCYTARFCVIKAKSREADGLCTMKLPFKYHLKCVRAPWTGAVWSLKHWKKNFFSCRFSNIDCFVKCFSKWEVDEHRGVTEVRFYNLKIKSHFWNRRMPVPALATRCWVTPVSEWRRQSKWFAQNDEQHKILQINKPGLRM